MRSLPCLVPLPEIRAEIPRVPLEAMPKGAGLARGPDTKDGWINGLSMARLYGPGYEDLRSEFPSIVEACNRLARDERSTIMQIMVNALAPHCALDKHRDGEPAMSRWHLPIITHSGVLWWDEKTGATHMTEGMWWGPVQYCGVLHSMLNGSDKVRVHVVVDML